MSAEEKITPDAAQALLDRDTLNRTNKVIKGGTLTVFDRRKLQKIIKRGQLKKPFTKAEKRQTVTEKPTKFEGTFEQSRRRRKVFELRLRNYSIREMADELEVSKGAIERDLVAINAALQKQINPLNATAIMNETLADYESVKLIALENLPSAEGNELAGLLNAITRANEAKTTLLQHAGVLPTAMRKVGVSQPDGSPIPLTSGDTHIHVSITKATKDTPPVVFKIIDMALDDEEAA